MSGLPGGSLWGGPLVTVPAGTVSIGSLIGAALRIAGITLKPGRIASTDQLTEAFIATNRMLGIWNTDRMKLFTVNINAYPLTAGQKMYTIGGPGLGADFNAARPQAITEANIIVTTTNPVVRTPVAILTDQQWSEIAVQDIPNGIPSKLYCDGNFPLSNIYLWTQPLTTYQLELYTWSAISTFTALSDAVSLPPGYEEAITYNMAVRVATLYPHDAKISPLSIEIARTSLADLASLNAPDPLLRADGAFLMDNPRNGWSYLTGR